jgi:hypothetical protein
MKKRRRPTQDQMKKVSGMLNVLFAALLLCVPLSAHARFAEGIVESVTNAPVVPDGTSAGAITDFVINLDSDMNPAVAGRTLRAGKTIRVSLPAAFRRDPAVPFRTLFSDPSCVPLNIQCNTAFLLQGWPQHPVGFPPSNMPNLWTVGFDPASNTIIIRALQDLPVNPPPEPGIKQIHLLLAGFTNPRPGLYRVRMVAETGHEGEPEIGWGRLLVLPRAGPAIAIASAFNPGAPNTIYQTAQPGDRTPLPYDLLLWDRTGAPMLNVTVHQIAPHFAELLQDGRVVGLVTIETPPGAQGQQVWSHVPSFPIASPVVGRPTARLTVFFNAGDVPGDYVIRFRLLGGRETVETFVSVQ